MKISMFQVDIEKFHTGLLLYVVEKGFVVLRVKEKAMEVEREREIYQ